MPDYELAARRAAKRYGVDPDIFVAQLRQESGLRPGLTSPKGASGIAQFIPGTAQAYGVNLQDGRVRDDLDGAARYMRDNLERTGGDYRAALSIYNSGRPDAYKNPNFAQGETYNYVRTIMGGAGTKSTLDRARKGRSRTSQESVTTTTTAPPGVDNSGLRRQLVGDFLAQGGVKNPGAVMSLAGAYGQAADTPGTTTTTTTTSTTKGGKVKGAPSSSAALGAAAALSWAESKIGLPSSRESRGENRGGLADYANERFGFGRGGGQPWCAMFTSLATTKGGAPKSARTASVAEVRRKALAGEGYRKGLVKKPRPGDLVLWGDRHIGMVKRVDGDTITYVAGNESDTVGEGTTSMEGVDVVRPDYGRR